MPVLENPRQESFCQQYVIDKNGTKAAIRAGYSKKTADQQASRLLTNVKIQARVQELLDEAAVRAKLTGDQVISELRSLAFWNIKDFIGRGNEVKNLSRMDRQILRPIVGIKTKTTSFYVGETKHTETTIELKLADKRAALVDLGRHLGIFKEDNDQKALKIKVTRK
jgi:phage terminase small subunit